MPRLRSYSQSPADGLCGPAGVEEVLEKGSFVVREATQSRSQRSAKDFGAQNNLGGEAASRLACAAAVLYQQSAVRVAAVGGLLRLQSFVELKRDCQAQLRTQNALAKVLRVVG